MTRWQANYTKFLTSWKEFPLGGFLSVLCVLAVNADLPCANVSRVVSMREVISCVASIRFRNWRICFSIASNPPASEWLPSLPGA